MDTSPWDIIIAGAAFALSFWLAWRQLWANRKAGVELRYEEARLPLHFPNQLAETEIVYRLVLTNHGPHVMRDIRLKVYRLDGKETRPAGGVNVPHDMDEATKLPDPLKVPAVYPSQAHHIPFVTALGNRPSHADLSWRDGRLRRQERRVWLSAVYC